MLFWVHSNHMCVCVRGRGLPMRHRNLFVFFKIPFWNLTVLFENKILLNKKRLSPIHSKTKYHTWRGGQKNFTDSILAFFHVQKNFHVGFDKIDKIQYYVVELRPVFSKVRLLSVKIFKMVRGKIYLVSKFKSWSKRAFNERLGTKKG